MSVQLDLSPDVEKELAAQATARGLSLDQYLQRTLQSMAQRARYDETLTPEERAEAFEKWATEFETDIDLPDEALSRESLYPPRW